MNGFLKVTPEKLIAAANEFNACSVKVGNLTTQMIGAADELKSSWSGEAATAYNTKFHQLDYSIQSMIRMIQEHVGDLQEMARAYQSAEQQAKDASAALPADPLC